MYRVKAQGNHNIGRVSRYYVTDLSLLMRDSGKPKVPKHFPHARGARLLWKILTYVYASWKHMAFVGVLRMVESESVRNVTYHGSAGGGRGTVRRKKNANIAGSPRAHCKPNIDLALRVSWYPVSNCRDPVAWNRKRFMECRSSGNRIAYLYILYIYVYIYEYILLLHISSFSSIPFLLFSILILFTLPLTQFPALAIVQLTLSSNKLKIQ